MASPALQPCPSLTKFNWICNQKKKEKEKKKKKKEKTKLTALPKSVDC